MLLRRLLGGHSNVRHDEASETPVQSWIMNALRMASRLGTPERVEQYCSDAPEIAAVAVNANPIYNPSAQAMTKNDVNVTDVESVRSKPLLQNFEDVMQSVEFYDTFGNRVSKLRTSAGCKYMGR